MGEVISFASLRGKLQEAMTDHFPPPATPCPPVQKIPDAAPIGYREFKNLMKIGAITFFKLDGQQMTPDYPLVIRKSDMARGGIDRASWHLSDVDYLYFTLANKPDNQNAVYVGGEHFSRPYALFYEAELFAPVLAAARRDMGHKHLTLTTNLS